MYQCQLLFGATRGQQIHELVEESIGGACPCLRGIPCPIAPGFGGGDADLVLDQAAI